MIGIAITMMAVVVYLGLRRVSVLVKDLAVARLESSSEGLKSNLEGSARQLRRQVIQLANAPELRRAASDFASRADVESARPVLVAALRGDASVAAVAVWSEGGELVAVEGDRDLARASPPPALGTRDGAVDTAAATAAAIQPLLARNDSVFIATTGRIAGTRDGAAHVVVTRRVRSTPAALNLLRRFVGPEARILLGNANGTVWTDFARKVEGPPFVPDSGRGEHSSRGVRHLHALDAIAGTPWVVMVEVPSRSVRAAAGEFGVRMTAIAACLLAIGALVLWLTIDRSLRPLRAITTAVARFGDGEAPVAVPVASDDEIGQLGSAFNSMAAQVRSSTSEAPSRAAALEATNQELRESEERYRVLVDHLPDGILVHRDQRIIFANTAAVGLIGARSSEELLGRSLREVVDQKDQAMVMDRARAVQATGTPAPAREVMVCRKDGTLLRVEAMSMPLNVGGRMAVQTILHDVTERHALEEQIRQAQKMDAIGRLAGGVAHDFNNILTVIDAYAEFAMRPDESDAARLEDIAEIRKASGSAARLTRQLLAFSRKQAVTPVNLDLNTVIDGVSMMLGRLMGNGIEIVRDLASPLGCLFADSSHVEQVLMNLSVNARDAMPEGGTLTFRTDNVTIGKNYRTPAGEPVPAGEYVLLAVADTGVGMTPEIRSRIFEPFFTTKQAGQGTGLGLSTVYGIVKQSGGVIWIDSDIGHGTTFNILFPRHAEDEDVVRMSRTSEHRILAATATLLLVEDQSSVREALSRALRNAGYVVHEAVDAEQAEAFLESPEGARVDLVLTDMMLPGKTGAEFTSSPLVADRGIPIIIMSGYSEEFTNREWRLPPNASYIDKPVSPSNLVRVIAKLIG